MHLAAGPSRRRFQGEAALAGPLFASDLLWSSWEAEMQYSRPRNLRHNFPHRRTGYSARRRGRWPQTLSSEAGRDVRENDSTWRESYGARIMCIDACMPASILPSPATTGMRFNHVEIKALIEFARVKHLTLRQTRIITSTPRPNRPSDGKVGFGSGGYL